MHLPSFVLAVAVCSFRVIGLPFSVFSPAYLSERHACKCCVARQELATSRHHHLSAAWDLCVNDMAPVNIPESAPPNTIIQFRVTENDLAKRPKPQVPAPEIKKSPSERT